MNSEGIYSMAGPGGARPGAGRKRKSEKFARQIDAAERVIADQLPGLLGNMLTLAYGVTVSEPGMDGTPVVYTKPPDYKANEYLINRIMGKPAERHEHDIDGEIAELVAILAAGRQEAT